MSSHSDTFFALVRAGLSMGRRMDDAECKEYSEADDY